MKKLIVAAAGFALLCLSAQPARGQGNPCCGAPIYYGPYHCTGGTSCGGVYIYSCNAYAGNDWMLVVTLCSTCNSFQSYAFAGYCYDGVVSSLRPPADDAMAKSGESPMYVDAYVRACTGRYVPVRMAMDRGG